jgi:hypothetical protein
VVLVAVACFTPSTVRAQEQPGGQAGAASSPPPSESPVPVVPAGPLPPDAPPGDVPPAGAPPAPPFGADLLGPSAGNFGGGAPGGRGGLFGSFNPVVGHLSTGGGYQATEFFDAPVRGQNTHLGYLRQDLNALTPLWQNDCNEVYANAHVGVETYSTGAVLPNTGDSFPAELWNVHVGTGYRHLFDNGWIAGGSVSVGSASDKPFHSIDEMSVSASGSLRVPQGERNAWLFTLSLSSNSQVLRYVPIPGVAFLYNPSSSFQAVIGFPFASVNWRPLDDLTLSASYALLTNFHLRATYRLARPLSVFAALDFNNENYYRAERIDVNQRFFYTDDQLSTGVQLALSRCAAVSLSGGYAFDRTYFEGRNFNDRGFNRIDVGAGAFVGARLQVRY